MSNSKFRANRVSLDLTNGEIYIHSDGDSNGGVKYRLAGGQPMHEIVDDLGLRPSEPWLGTTHCHVTKAVSSVFGNRTDLSLSFKRGFLHRVRILESNIVPEISYGKMTGFCTSELGVANSSQHHWRTDWGDVVISYEFRDGGAEMDISWKESYSFLARAIHSFKRKRDAAREDARPPNKQVSAIQTLSSLFVAYIRFTLHTTNVQGRWSAGI